MSEELNAVDPARRKVPVIPFGPGDLIWELFGDLRFNVVIPGAAYLQVMNPAIGAGVSEFSVVRTDPYARAIRSLVSIYDAIYGGDKAFSTYRNMRDLHKDIAGVDFDGNKYHALNGRAYAFVWASGVQAFLLSADTMFTPKLDNEGRERFYEELKNLARILGVVERNIPATLTEFWVDYAEHLTHVNANPMSRELDGITRYPPLPPVIPTVFTPAWWPIQQVIGYFNSLLTRGSLNLMGVREKAGVPWSKTDERVQRAIFATARTVVPLLPEWIRYLPPAAKARREARKNDAPGYWSTLVASEGAA